MTLIELTEILGIKILLEFENELWSASLDNCEIKDGGSLVVASGSSPKIKEALQKLISQIRGQKMALKTDDISPKINSRIFKVPKTIELGDLE